MTTAFVDQAIHDLRADFHGELIEPGSTDYEAARRVRNGLINRFPAVIARCAGVADVTVAVNFAREHELPLSVRAGAHNVAGNATNDGGIVIDLSAMRGVRVDAASKTARVQGGATWGDVDRETQLFGLATPGGLVSSTGIAGLTLHGGWGWLRRKFGYSVDNLISVDIVTADGDVLVANESENSDLFWAIRGAGSNFGVVTSFEFRLHEVGPMIAFAGPMYAMADAERVALAWRDFMASAPNEVSSSLLFWGIPAVDSFPSELHNAPIVAPIAMYSGPAEEGERVLRPLREITSTMLDLSGQMPYASLQSAFDPLFPKDRLYYWKSLNLINLEEKTMEATIRLARDRPSAMSLMALWHLDGGAASQVEVDTMAYSQRSTPFLLSLDTTWDDSADTDRCIAWTRDAWSEMQRFSDGGLYLNFAGFGEEKEALVRAGYGANYERLVALKTKYDPDNLFRMNQNIRPSH